MAKEGMTFGTSAHYDSACEGTFTIQYTGHKHWALYAPWDIEDDDIRVHDRFESIVRPGDIMVYGPAWFHHTRVIEGHGDSVGAAYYTGNIPFFGVHRDISSLALSPLGFGACTGEGPSNIIPMNGQWFAQSRRWEAVLGKLSKEEL